MWNVGNLTLVVPTLKLLHWEGTMWRHPPCPPLDLLSVFRTRHAYKCSARACEFWRGRRSTGWGGDTGPYQHSPVSFSCRPAQAMCIVLRSVVWVKSSAVVVLMTDDWKQHDGTAAAQFDAECQCQWCSRGGVGVAVLAGQCQT